LRQLGKLVVQRRRSIGGERVDAEGSGSRGERGVVDRPGRDAEALEPQALDYGRVQEEVLDADATDPPRAPPIAPARRAGRRPTR
jgi:hypothetical protein